MSKINMKPKEVEKFRLANQMSQIDLAEKLGVTVQAVKNWEEGVRGVSETTGKVLKLLSKYPQLIKEF